MFAGTASGELLPPYVCYKAERMYDTWALGGPPGTRYNRSKSGWFDDHAFKDWFETIVLPWAKSCEGPNVVIGDNLSTHFSSDVLKLCDKYDIKFVCLPPNATHLLQPLDVAFFRPLKGAWRNILLEWKIGADRRLSTLPKHLFPSLLKKLIEAIAPNEAKNLKSGFSACGIYPLNPQHVLDKIQVRNQNVVLESPTKKPRQLVGDAVIDFLSVLRHSPGQDKPKRKKKINVPAGMSISANDIEAPEPSCSGEQNSSKSTKSKKRIRTFSSSSEEGQVSLKDSSDEFHVSEPEESLDEVVFKDPAAGDWLLVKFPGKKDIKYYVGLVEEVVPEGLGMSFASRIVNNVDKFTFKWPNPEDRCVIDYDQVERNIGLPYFNYKNDRLVSFKFKCSFDGYLVK